MNRFDQVVRHVDRLIGLTEEEVGQLSVQSASIREAVVRWRVVRTALADLSAKLEGHKSRQLASVIEALADQRIRIDRAVVTLTEKRDRADYDVNRAVVLLNRLVESSSLAVKEVWQLREERHQSLTRAAWEWAKQTDRAVANLEEAVADLTKEPDDE